MSAGHGPLVIEGDIQRRSVTTYAPDLYKDYEILQPSLEVLRNAFPIMDWVLEHSKGVSRLVDVDECPVELLPKLGALLGYAWDESETAETQRQEIRKLVDIYHIRGTEDSVVRLVLNVGATHGEVFTPFEKTFVLNKSILSGGFRFEDAEFWRWGTYEVVADVDFSRVYSKIQDVHPAGSKWFGRQLIAGDDEVGSVHTVEEQAVGIHTFSSNYWDANRDLIGTPSGYWKLNEPASLGVTIIPGSGSSYGSSVYDLATYGASASGLIAEDSSTGSADGLYNIESESLGWNNGAYRNITSTSSPSTILKKATFTATPVISGSVIISSLNLYLTDDGLGKLRKYDSDTQTYSTTNKYGEPYGYIDYNTGELFDLTFDDSVIETIKEVPHQTPPEVTPTATLRYEYHSGITVDEASRVSAWAPTTGSNNLSNTVEYAQQPVLQDDGELHFGGDDLLKFDTTVALSTTHTISAVVRLDSSVSGRNNIFGGGTNFEIGYDATANNLYYKAGSTNEVTTSFDPDLSKWFVLTAHRDGTSVEFFVDGVSLGSGTLSSNTDFDLLCIGADDPTTPLNRGNFYFKEVAIYSTALSDSAQHESDSDLASGHEIRLDHRVHLDGDYIGGNQVWAAATELIGTGDGSKIFFTATLSEVPIPGSVQISDGTVTFTDPDEDGNLKPSAGSHTGTVNYSSGAVTIIYSTALANAVAINADYNYFGQYSNGGDWKNGPWLDETIFNHDFDQSDAAQRPSVSRDALHLNSVLKFEAPEVLEMSSSVNLGTDHTIFAVVSPISPDGGTFNGILGGPSDSLLEFDDDSVRYGAGSGNTFTTGAGSASFSANGWYLVTVVRSGANVTIYVNGQEIGADSSFSATADFQLQYVGASTAAATAPSCLNGSFAELLVLDGALNNIDRAGIETHLLSKFALLREPVTAYYNDYVERGLPDHLLQGSDTASFFHPQFENAYVQVNIGSGLQPGNISSDWMVGLWVRPETLHTGGFWSAVWGSNFISLTLNRDSTVTAKIYDGTDTNELTSTLFLPQKEWGIVSLGLTSTTMFMYINGADAGTTTLAGTPQYDPTVMFIGAPPIDTSTGQVLTSYSTAQDNVGFFYGTLSDVAIYKGADVPSKEDVETQFEIGTGKPASVIPTITVIRKIIEDLKTGSQGFTLGSSDLGGEDRLGSDKNVRDFSITVWKNSTGNTPEYEYP